MEEFMRFLKIDVNGNVNRYLNIEVKGESFVYTVGRNGAKGFPQKKSIRFLETFIDRKIKEGYVKISLEAESGNSAYREIENKAVRNLVESLLAYADKALKEVNIDFNAVSDDSIEKAQELIYKLYGAKDVAKFNKILEQLFVTVPRKMKVVSDFLAHDKNEFTKIVIREQSLLDNIKSKKANKAGDTSADDDENKKTILETMGVEIFEADEKTTKQVYDHLHPEVKKKFSKVFVVRNHKTFGNFKKYMEENNMDRNDIHFYYHGSLNQNQWGLITQGPHIVPPKGAKITGKMFGFGTYWANNAQKSANYTSLSGSYWAHGNEHTAFLQVYKVAYKKPLVLDHYENRCSSFTKNTIGDHDAVFAKAANGFLFHDEIITYDDRAATIAYLIELES